MDANRGIWLIATALLALGVAGFVLGWGSSLVHLLGVLVVMLLLYQGLKRRAAAPAGAAVKQAKKDPAPGGSRVHDPRD